MRFILHVLLRMGLLRCAEFDTKDTEWEQWHDRRHNAPGRAAVNKHKGRKSEEKRMGGVGSAEAACAELPPGFIAARLKGYICQLQFGGNIYIFNHIISLVRDERLYRDTYYNL